MLKIAGAALLAGFTAIFTNYLIRARLGGALEVRRIPDGGHVVVCGLGNVGFRCVEELVRMGEPVVAVDRVNDNPFAATVRRMGRAGDRRRRDGAGGAAAGAGRHRPGGDRGHVVGAGQPGDRAAGPAR